MSICPTCDAQANDPVAMRDWIWARQGNEGNWFCCWDCLGRYAMSKPDEDVATQYKPTPEEERRMME